MAKIEIEGKKYKVVENLSFHNIGMQSKVVEIELDREQVVIKKNGKWRFWTTKDRLGIR